MDELRTEADLVLSWQHVDKPLVSIACTTYNHARYLSEALHGFLIQETNFPFEIVIHDDASTDGTQEIIVSYAERYPRTIRTVLQTVNQHSQGINSALVAFSHCRGNYIAFCEGDDYWTDPCKLQLQVDMMRSKPAITLTFHDCLRREEARGDRTNERACLLEKKTFTLEDIVQRDWFIPSQSMVFRADTLQHSAWMHHVFGLDWAMHLLLAEQGEVHFIDRIMGVYRINGASISANRPPGFFQVKHIQTLSYFNVHTEFRHDELISSRLDRERKLLYLAYLNGQPAYIRFCSLDYYRFKLGNILKRWRRQATSQVKQK